ncbi:Outer membrane protein (porin) [Paraburkholderia fungorum]|uniref:Outer membrane protein (Porin) n=1 Tax=Paraburkholderia fungorum TaxID=134537 RepID=A0A1H1JUZ5_9BURK|nr:porin [Paraburkholderia fungorum]SDR53891.1 Outer membrane protein (porin) [Paraburkholderia fungorum]
MKKITLAASAISVIAASTSAQAQSTVTLYGLLDVGIGYVKTTSGNSYQMLSGNLQGSRWGLKGQEDLGGGLKAIFQLENGYSVATGKLGQGGREFGRQATVGLTSASWGTVKLGRSYDATVDLVQGVTGDLYGAVFSTPANVDNNDNSMRVSNQIKYISPNYAGLQFEAQYALGGAAGAVGQGYTYSAGAAYTHGALSVAAAYFQATNPNPDAAKRSGWTSTTADSILNGASITAGYGTAHTIAISQVAGQYVIGPMTVGVGYSNTLFKADGFSTFNSTQKFNTGRAFIGYQVTPAITTAIGYAYTSATGNASAHYNQISAASMYALSKRTDVYAVAGYQRASGEQRTAAGGIQSALASVGDYGVDGTKDQTIAIVGIRHKF